MILSRVIRNTVYTIRMFYLQLVVDLRYQLSFNPYWVKIGLAQDKFRRLIQFLTAYF